MSPVQSSGPIGSRICCILVKSLRSRSIISACGTPRNAVAASLTFWPITASPCGAGTSPLPVAASNALKYPSVVSTIWATTSAVVQPSQAGGGSHSSGRSASANIRSASSRTTRRMVSFPSYVIAFHSLMPCTSLGDTPLLVELTTTEVHQWITQNLDLDAVGVFEVHRLLDPTVRSCVLHARLVQPAADLLPTVSGSRDRDVLDRSDGLDAWLQSQPGEVEEAQQRLVAKVEEEVRRPCIVTVLDQLNQRESEQALIKLDRLLDCAT